MRNLVRTSIVVLGASALGGCFATFDPYPVAGNPVNPAPVGDYRVRCNSHPSPIYVIAENFMTECRQEIGPAEPVIRARG